MINHNEEYRIIKQGQITAEFNGFDSDMSFHLEDGTYYYQTEYKYHYHYAYRPIVEIRRIEGRTYLFVGEMNDLVQVQETSAITSRIEGEFVGWSGNSVFNLANGQVWQQDKYSYKYFYAYSPKVEIIKVGSKFIMVVKGKRIQVKRIR